MGLLPIRKTAPERVALTSYYGKNFIDRSEKVASNYGVWIIRKLSATGEDAVPSVSEVNFANVFDSKAKVSRTYSAISKEITSFKVNGFTLSFDYGAREKLYGVEAIKKLETKGHVICGKGKGGLITLDETDNFYFNKDGNIEELGSFTELLNITDKPPIEFATITVYGKSIPLALALTYKLGIDKLLKKLKAEHRIVPKGTRVSLNDDEYAIQFKDETIVASRNDKVASLILSGFNDYKRHIKSFDLNDFNHKDTIFTVLNRNQLGVRYAREIELMFDMFIDHYTLELLQRMDEPTNFTDLLIRGADLLVTDRHPDETQLDFMRLKGYERFPGLLYRQLVDSIRKYRQQPPGRAKLEMNPRAVWMDIVKDQSVSLVEDSNPIHNLKEKELVTYSGQGGRSAQSMVKRTRVFHETDKGTISEATVDSSKVAINSYLSANPNLNSLRGTSKQFDSKTDSPTALLSTSALLYPMADKDDTKRVGFISVQASSGVAANGYVTPPLRTGYETVMAHRTDDLYSYVAKQDGKIIELSEDLLKVEYKDGKVEGVELGTRYGKVTGTTVPHTVVCDLAQGKKFKEGDVLAFNSGFYARDFFDRSQVTLKLGTMASVALMETTDTLEDSCAISQELAGKMVMPVSKARHIHVSFGQEIHNLVGKGLSVNSDSILCTIVDDVASGGDLFDEETLNSLSNLAANTPKAKMEGTVSKIEVLYHGDKKDMSPSLKAIADKADRDRSKTVRGLENNKATSGQVHDVIRVDGNKLELDQAIITVYIDGVDGASVGEKGTFGNMLKTVIGRVFTGTNETVDGIQLDATFSYRAIANRIVLSPEIAGTTNSLMKVLSKKVAEIYRG